MKNLHSPQKGQVNQGGSKTDTNFNGNMNSNSIHSFNFQQSTSQLMGQGAPDSKSPTNIYSYNLGDHPISSIGIGSQSIGHSSQQNTSKNSLFNSQSHQKNEDIVVKNDLEQQQSPQSTIYSSKSIGSGIQVGSIQLSSYNSGQQQNIQKNPINTIVNQNNIMNTGQININSQLNKNQSSNSTYTGSQQMQSNSSFFTNNNNNNIQQDQSQIYQSRQQTNTSMHLNPSSTSQLKTQKNNIVISNNPLISQSSDMNFQYQNFNNANLIQLNQQNINNKLSQINYDQKNIGGIGLVSMDISSISGIQSNVFSQQGQTSKIISSNENLSTMILQDVQGSSNANYFNFQDFAINSQNSTSAKVNSSPTNQNIINQKLNLHQENNINQKLPSQKNLVGNMNNQIQYSPKLLSQNKTENIGKVTSLTANNTPHKSQITQSVINNGQGDIKTSSYQIPIFDGNQKNNLSKALSPARNGQLSTKNGNNSGGFTPNSSNNKSNQNQKRSVINSVSQSSLNQAGGNTGVSGSYQQQLLSSQKSLVQSIVLQRKRSQSPQNIINSGNFNEQSINMSKQLLSANIGQTSQSSQFNQLGQSLNPSTSMFSNCLANQYNNVNGTQGFSYNTAKNSSTMLSMSPDNKQNNSNSIGFQQQSKGNQSASQALSPKQANHQQQQGPTSQNNFYKVASQIRRNQLKEKRPSLLNSQSTNSTGVLLNKRGSINGNVFPQININSSVNVGVVTQLSPQQQLVYSQNYGKADPINELQKQQYLLQQRQSQQQVSGVNKRQNSSGSQGSKSQDNKESLKRFTMVEKFNEKYTKKLIIDLQNYNDGNPENNIQQIEKEGEEGNFVIDEEDPVKRTNAFSKNDKKNWANNSNMNMLDILSQQRVLQRSVSNQKRNILSSNQNRNGVININQNNLNSQSKSTSSSANKRLSFRYNDKPWENTSFNNNSKFNSKYGSFSVMKSMNNSQSNWNLNGSQNLNSSVSSLKNNEGKSTLSNLRTIQLQGSTHLTATNDKNTSKNYKKRLSNNFILAGFNESQEINSSRNQNIGNRLKNKGSNVSDNGNILSKNITSDLTPPHSSSNNKYKFISTKTSHLNKPTSQNTFTKQIQLQKNQIDVNQQDQNNKVKQSPSIGGLNKEKQVGSPLPTSLANSKNSTKCEIKKSQIISGPSSQHNKNRFSDHNCSQQESFTKDQDEEEEFQGHEDDEYDEDQKDEDIENEEDEEDQQSDGSNSSNSKAISNYNSQMQGIPAQEQNIHQISHQQRINNNGEGLRPSTMIPVQTYNFESNLEHIPGLQINIEELRKERSKLIRKITQTFKVKNKALSTSQEYYKILHVIGKGAFAKVCLAIQLLTGKFVAIKLIDKQILSSESAKKRVLQEVQILKKLNNHKHVLKLLEVFENRKLIFIVTEYFRGQDLMKMMKERNGEPFTENQVRHMLVQILSGLRYIHGNWVLHRDIKLDNLLVDSQLNLKIIDFGISRIIQKDQKMMEQCGTPAFLAPEIIANKGYEGFGSDMWSLGVLIYILLFGKVPFKGNNLSELHRNILNGIIPIEEMRETNVSFDSQNLVQRILKLKVKERLDLEGIINSPWLKGFQIPDGIENKELYQKQKLYDMYPDQQEKNSAVQQTEQFDEKVIGYIESFGYSREYILRCLNKSGLSHVNAIYKVIKNSQIQQTQTIYS